MYEINPILAIDSYKLGHMTMYPPGTSKVYCNLTARDFKHIRTMFPKDFPFFNDKMVVFGVSAAIQEIVESFDKGFFAIPLDDVVENFRTSARPFIGDNDDSLMIENVTKLHKLGYLPLVIKSLPEGIQIRENIPMMTITNCHPDFAWLPNYLETFISSQVWKLSTTATIAKVYKNIFDYYAKLTGTHPAFTAFQGHDFSCRGMSGFADTARTGAGHLTSFVGTDSVSSVDYVKKYYKADGLIGASVPATEHSVMSMGILNEFSYNKYKGEVDTFRRIFKLYPKGVVSIVSDTYDFWQTITKVASELKEDIMSREEDSNGLCKTVFRPDSGDPVKVICGNRDYNLLDEDYTNIMFYPGRYGKDYMKFDELHPEDKGAIHCLYETFGGEFTETGHIQLDKHVGIIYGDSITPVRAYDILDGLYKKGFASGNVVLGIGSYTYQHITRDTLGFAIKATYAEIDGRPVSLYKEPKTDAAKKSAKGLLRVDKIGDEYVLIDNCTSDNGGELKTIFEDGSFVNLPTFAEIRKRLSENE